MSNIKYFYKQHQIFSAHDPVHQQEGHLRPVHEAPGRVPPAQRRGHLRQVHQHALPGTAQYNTVQYTNMRYQVTVK